MIVRLSLALAMLAAVMTARSASTAGNEIVYASSLWSGKAHHVTGLYTITQHQDGFVLSLSDDFKAKPGPGLKIILSPLEPRAVNSKNALRGSVEVAPLQSLTGAQEYPLDSSIDLAAFHSVLIYSGQKSRLWSAVALRRGRVIARGNQWQKKTKKTWGAFEIAEIPDGRVIRFAEDFKTAKAPEPLRIIISEHTTQSASNKNAMNKGHVVGTMRHYKGGQSHPLPADLELKPGMTLLLHCEKYTKLWSAAAIHLETD